MLVSLLARPSICNQFSSDFTFSSILHFDTNSENLKCDMKILSWAWSKMGMVTKVHICYDHIVVM